MVFHGNGFTKNFSEVPILKLAHANFEKIAHFKT
jgi:hypothetical protein